MDDLWRAPYLHALQDGWGTYVDCFRQFSAQQQDDFLKKQGYARLGDLLGHVIAWWEEGLPVVRRRLTDPDSPSQEYDVDDFNACAVKRFSQFDEATVIEMFEARRQDWIKLVESLPETAQSNKLLIERLHIELIGHLSEHEIETI